MVLPSSPGCLPVTQRVLPCTRPHPFRDSQEDAHLTLPPSASSRCPTCLPPASPRAGPPSPLGETAMRDERAAAPFGLPLCVFSCPACFLLALGMWSCASFQGWVREQGQGAERET